MGKTASHQPPQTSEIRKLVNSGSLCLRSYCSSSNVLINTFFSLFHSVSRAKNNRGEVEAAASNCLMMVRVAVKMEAQNEK
jgi:hypothetical protein